MTSHLVEHGALHRKKVPIRIVGRMGARQHVERLLEITIVGERAPESGQQRLVAGMGYGGLFKHGRRLGALPGGAQSLAIGQRGIGIPGIGAIAFAGDLGRALRIGAGTRLRAQ